MPSPHSVHRVVEGTAAFEAALFKEVESYGLPVLDGGAKMQAPDANPPLGHRVERSAERRPPIQSLVRAVAQRRDAALCPLVAVKKREEHPTRAQVLAPQIVGELFCKKQQGRLQSVGVGGVRLEPILTLNLAVESACHHGRSPLAVSGRPKPTPTRPKEKLKPLLAKVVEISEAVHPKFPKFG
jgi:hypothetical protein